MSSNILYPKANASHLKAIRALGKKNTGEESGLFCIEGTKLILEAMEAGWDVQTLLIVPVTSGPDPAKTLLRTAVSANIPVLRCSPNEMASVSTTEHAQGILAVVARQERALVDIPRGKGEVLVALDGVQDPGNVGTCIRSAAWFGAAGVFLGKGCASLYNDKTVRSTAGSLFTIPCVEHEDLPPLLSELQQEGFHVVGADAASDRSYDTFEQERSVVLVLGSEAHGISKAVRECVETFVSIPRKGKGESLNVSIAGSVILSHLARRGTGKLL